MVLSGVVDLQLEFRHFACFLFQIQLGRRVKLRGGPGLLPLIEEILLDLLKKVGTR